MRSARVSISALPRSMLARASASARAASCSGVGGCRRNSCLIFSPIFTLKVYARSRPTPAPGGHS